MNGALDVRERIPDALLVFVRAPSRDEQRRRLEARAPMAGGRWSAGWPGPRRRSRPRREFDAVIVNDDVDRATAELAAIVEVRRSGAR